VVYIIELFLEGGNLLVHIVRDIFNSKENMSFVDIIGNMSYEVVAAASIVAASVATAAAAYSSGNSKKRMIPKEEKEYVSPKKKHRKVVSKETFFPKESKLVQNFIELGISPETVVDEFKRNSIGKWRHKTVYTFLDDKGNESVHYSFEDVDRIARKIAATLQKDHLVVKGDRVMLCFPPGLDFALGFWGCLYAGGIAIPVYPPYPGTLAKDLPKFNRMVEDSGTNVILTNRTYSLASKMATAKNFFSNTLSRTKWPENVEWVTVDSISDAMANEYIELSEPLCLEDIAFFQYSSGSTSAPKAVMISHSNIRAQLETWKSIEPSDVLVSWLPSYHDMGLVGFIISPCVMGSRCISMSPISFIKNPSIWMQTVSKYKATHICAPNFGYALVARKMSDAQASQLDLSSLKQTICAAEPIRLESLMAFTQKFQTTSGFDPKTFNCGYGLAEVTLVCTGQDPLQRKEPVVLQVKKSFLEQKKQVQILQETSVINPVKKLKQQEDTMVLVGCGKAMPTFEVVIVDPDTRLPCKDQHIGEIWITGPSVAQGYYLREEYTTQMFHATLAKKKSKTFLRSGDLGFLYKGQVFVTGRLKDLIIIRGRNICPQDVEATIEKANEEIRPGCVAAFSIEKKKKEQEQEEEEEEVLVVVAEIRNAPKSKHGGPKNNSNFYEKICTQLVTSIFMEHQLKCEAIVLLPTRAIPKTTSGKIQRSKAKSQFLAKKFNTKPLYIHSSSHHQQHEQHFPVSTTSTSSPQEQQIVNSSPKKTSSLSLSKISSKEQPQVNGHGVIKSEEEILEWLMQRVKREATPDILQDVTLDTPWACFGLDSIAIVSLSAEFGEFLGCVVPPSAFFQYDTPEKLAKAPGLATGDLELETIDETLGIIGGGETTEESLTLMDSSFYVIEAFPEVQKLKKQMKEFEQAGLQVPYLEVLPIPSKRKQMINFNTYNYLGNALHAEVMTAAKKAIDVHGCTMSSSPIVGQTQVNVALEKSLSEFFHAEAAALFVGGWVTNVTCIDALVGKGDLILADALNHDSCVTGQRLSGATILPFPHNDIKALENILKRVRMKYRRVLLVVEGVYSMDGDLTPLQEIIALKKKYKAIVFLDEAHSFGTMGKFGRGMVEHCGVDPKDIDIRMGTMSKALGSVGGFILGSKALISYIKHCAGGFVFSVGLAPVCAGAALKSIELMTRSCINTQRLQFLSAYFYDLCKDAKLPMCKTGFRGAPVIVVIIGSTIDTAKASIYLSEKANINVKPIVYPAVEEGKCRLRFFISVLHTEEQLEKTVQLLAMYMHSVQACSKLNLSI
jgi:7-keto-8-aminopelargonate synthetase-like enzyme/acyl-CoA synthetase (AMP-forming)/AMP-acid ligase II/acyl carrier protein